MKLTWTTPLLGLLFTVVAIYSNPASSYNHNNDFERGFQAGFQSEAGTMTLVPITPIAPFTPLNSTPYLEGIRRGSQDAQERQQSSPYNNYPNTRSIYDN